MANEQELNEIRRFVFETAVTQYTDLNDNVAGAVEDWINNAPNQLLRNIQNSQLIDNDDLLELEDAIVEDEENGTPLDNQTANLLRHTGELIFQRYQQQQQGDATDVELSSSDEDEPEGAGMSGGNTVTPVNYNHGSIPFGDFF